MILDEIVAYKRVQVAEEKRRVPLAQARANAEAAPLPRDFQRAVARESIALIAEIKRASPSRGSLNGSIDAASLARAYVENGAAAISVLTDERFFRGTRQDLEMVHAAVDVPILRKDFVLDERQIYESRACGASAILLIVRILADAQLRDFVAQAQSLGMQALVEIHDEGELERALSAGALIIGINNRNLADFTVNLATTEQLAPRIPKDRIVVAESGIFARADVERAGRVGVQAVLVGEALVRAGDVGAKVKELAGVKRFGVL